MDKKAADIAANEMPEGTQVAIGTPIFRDSLLPLEI